MESPWVKPMRRVPWVTTFGAGRPAGGRGGAAEGRGRSKSPVDGRAEVSACVADKLGVCPLFSYL